MRFSIWFFMHNFEATSSNSPTSAEKTEFVAENHMFEPKFRGPWLEAFNPTKQNDLYPNSVRQAGSEITEVSIRSPGIRRAPHTLETRPGGGVASDSRNNPGV